VGEGQRPGEIVDPGPTPEFAAQVVDEFRELLRQLGDDGQLGANRTRRIQP
jgi:hypothetical protein